MTKHEAQWRGLKLTAKITGISGLAIVGIALTEAHTEAATREPSSEVAPGESILKGGLPTAGNCGCAPCWGPPAPPARGMAS